LLQLLFDLFADWSVIHYDKKNKISWRMNKRQLGNTDMHISRLGIGLSEIGFGRVGAEVAGDVLNTALDAGINFLDTAECYEDSEELLGRAVSHRRNEFFLATKTGHVSGDFTGKDWSVKIVRDSIDRSLKRMKTDYVDLLQLHSCSVSVLEKGEVIQILQEAKQAGKTRYLGYSGDNDAAQWAVESGLFDTLQTSFNLVDQKARLGLLGKAKAKNMGVIVKRPIANGAWGAAASPSDYADDYFKRAQKMLTLGDIPEAPDDRILLALGFTLAHDEIDTVIVGTKTPKYIQRNIEMLGQLPISKVAIAELYGRFEKLGKNWGQLT
jgi:aryl-alcohol dehydrogenase-like predicted oxidoreductase